MEGSGQHSKGEERKGWVNIGQMCVGGVGVGSREHERERGEGESKGGKESLDDIFYARNR